MMIALSVVVNNFKRALNLVKAQMGGRYPPCPHSDYAIASHNHADLLL